MDTQVIIAGAGPTGLTLAVDLGMRGIGLPMKRYSGASVVCSLPFFMPRPYSSRAIPTTPAIEQSTE